MATNAKVIKVGKLDAAKRQLETAITLWFNDGDPVCIHTLAFAAYEIIHAVSKKRDPNRRDLLFDTLIIKDEYRGEFNIRLKKYAYFFKHGDRDPDAVIDFAPIMSNLYLMFAILGLELCGERKSAAESAFMWWLYIEKPHWLTAAGSKLVADNIPSENLAYLRSRPKAEFLEAFRVARAQRGE
jgi:hypothetical protein